MVATILAFTYVREEYFSFRKKVFHLFILPFCQGNLTQIEGFQRALQRFDACRQHIQGIIPSVNGSELFQLGDGVGQCLNHIAADDQRA